MKLGVITKKLAKSLVKCLKISSLKEGKEKLEVVKMGTITQMIVG